LPIAFSKPEEMFIAISQFLTVNRCELKFLISQIDYINLRTGLSNILTEDVHNGYSGYMIRSLYFDSFAETDFYQKFAGENIRKKIRLRTYDARSEKLKLELKRKENTNQRKQSFSISKNDAKKLIECDYDVLDHVYGAESIKNIMKINHTRPVVTVEYNRLAYTHMSNNIRITLDSNIRSSETQFDIFDENLVLTPVEEFAFGLLEVKYDKFLPGFINELLSQFSSQFSSYSKYTNSRTLFANYLA
jgi:hypothetical protein